MQSDRASNATHLLDTAGEVDDTAFAGSLVPGFHTSASEVRRARGMHEVVLHNVIRTGRRDVRTRAVYGAAVTELNFTAPSGDKDLEMDVDTEEVEIPVAPKTPPRKRGDDDAYGDENKAENENVASEDASASDSNEAMRIMLMPPEGEAMLVDTRSPVSATRSMQTAEDDFEDVSSSFQSAETRPPETPAAPDAPTERRRREAFGVNDKPPPPIDYADFKDLCHHASDITVRPIVSNHRIEVVQDAPHDAEKLPFKDLSVDEMLATSTFELEAFLTRIYRSVAHPSNVQEKVNTLAYFETLCTEASSANVFSPPLFFDAPLVLDALGPPPPVPIVASLASFARAAARLPRADTDICAVTAALASSA